MQAYRPELKSPAAGKGQAWLRLPIPQSCRVEAKREDHQSLQPATSLAPGSVTGPISSKYSKERYRGCLMPALTSMDTQVYMSAHIYVYVPSEPSLTNKHTKENEEEATIGPNWTKKGLPPCPLLTSLLECPMWPKKTTLLERDLEMCSFIFTGSWLCCYDFVSLYKT